MCVVRHDILPSAATASASTPVAAGGAVTPASNGFGVDTVWSASLDGKLIVWHAVVRVRVCVRVGVSR
jgi:hypothetical protein